jgi:hypothetical protein
MLNVTTVGLKSVSSTYLSQSKLEVLYEEKRQRHEHEEAVRKERVRRGYGHDGRLDSISGNGIMSELGFGDERIRDEDLEASSESILEDPDEKEHRNPEKQATTTRRGSPEDLEVVKSLPIVVVRNFAAQSNAHQELLDVMAAWCASLTENKVELPAYLATGTRSTFCQIAHVIVISDNRENVKRIAKGMSPVHAL